MVFCYHAEICIMKLFQFVKEHKSVFSYCNGLKTYLLILAWLQYLLGILVQWKFLFHISIVLSPLLNSVDAIFEHDNIGIEIKLYEESIYLLIKFNFYSNRKKNPYFFLSYWQTKLFYFLLFSLYVILYYIFFFKLLFQFSLPEC